MKKLLAMLTVGSVLALTTGCPPAPTTEPVKVVPKVTPEHKTPEVKPETKHEVKPEPKPEVKPEPKPEVKPEPKPEVKPEPKPEVKPEPKPAVEAKTETGKVEKGEVMVNGKKVEVPASAEVWINGKKDELKNIKDGSEVTVTMDKDGKVTKVEEKK